MDNKELLDFNDNKYIILGLITIVVIFGALLIWAVSAKIDTVIISTGKIVVKSYKKPVEHKDWGTVTKIFVQEGSFVKKSSPLIELEKVEQDTSLKITKSEYFSFLAQRDRLLSEKKGLKSIKFSKEFLELDNRNLKNELIKTQKELFTKRRKKLFSELTVLKERETQLKENIKGLEQLIKLKKSLLVEYKNQLFEEKKLIEEGLSDKDKENSLKEKIKKIEVELQDLENRILQARLQIKEINEQKKLKLEEYQTDIATELESILIKLSQLKYKMELSSIKVKKSVIKAPASGQIIGLKIKSVGQVVHPGDILMYIVPKKDELFIQAKIDPKDRDKVKPGQLVDLHFPSFLSIGANIVEGKVTYVASDTLFDEINKKEYYEVHIIITEKGKNQLKNYGFKIIPGMPVTAFIKVEKITPIEYILQPVLLMIKSSFTSN